MPVLDMSVGRQVHEEAGLEVFFEIYSRVVPGAEVEKLRPIIGDNLPLRSPVIAVKLTLLTNVRPPKESCQGYEVRRGLNLPRLQQPVPAAVDGVHLTRRNRPMLAIC